MGKLTKSSYVSGSLWVTRSHFFVTDRMIYSFLRNRHCARTIEGHKLSWECGPYFFRSYSILFFFLSLSWSSIFTVFSSLSYSLLLIFLVLSSSSHLLFSFLAFSICPIFSFITFFCYSCYELFLRRFLSECWLHIFLL